ncbi:hypothetical protein [Rhodoblastus sp.]|uniref:hypothetical protein n=1 Tax=Rhodoblastus sp. TaxID=1962975 RepID=UPI003F96BC13
MFSGAPAQAQEPSLWDKALSTVGIGGAKPAAPATPAPVSSGSVSQAPASSGSVSQAPASPAAVSQAPANPAPASQPARPAPVVEIVPQKPGMFDNVLKTVGLGGAKPMDTIDYSERPKLAVPQQRTLPPPQESGGPRQVAKRPESEALTKPPAEYTEKVRGADGQVSGLKESDVAKEKKFLNFF